MSTPDKHSAKTAKLVPLSDLTALARLGLALLRLHRDFTDQVLKQLRKTAPAAAAPAAMCAAERRFETAAAEALKLEEQKLPGMGEDGT